MLEKSRRFFVPTGAITPGGPSKWHVVDFDQRPLIVVLMDEEQEEDDAACEFLGKYIDGLPPDVCQVHFSAEGSLISSSSDPKDDETRCVFHPPLTALRHDPSQVVTRAELLEIDRLTPNIDMVVCPGTSDPETKLVFKYYFLYAFLWTWREMCLWRQLPKHPNIVPFDEIVVDEIEGNFVGFTTVFIPGGTLDENKSRTFKLKWLQQLVDVIDLLNLTHGISHQDVAPRNLLIDENKDDLLIFDFNYSTRIYEDEYVPSRNDVKGVIFTMYEIITRDTPVRGMRHDLQKLSEIEDKEWLQHPDTRLDSSVSEFRELLRTWSSKRTTTDSAMSNMDTSKFIDWPSFPKPPKTEIIVGYTDGKAITQPMSLFDERRTEILGQGKAVLNWQRPPQTQLKTGERRLLTTGDFVKDSKEE